MKKQSGFAVLEVVLVAVVLLVIGVTVYSYVSRTASDDTGSTASTATVPAAPQVKSTADLDKASAALDSVDVDDNYKDSAQLDLEMTSF